MYSRQDFTGCTFLEAKDLDGITITGSCFSQEEPDTEVFPHDVKDLTLEYCNLDNVVIPKGATVINCANRRFKRQNDGNYWEVDDKQNPTSILNHNQLVKLGITPPSPDEIPDEKLEESVVYMDTARNVRAG